MNVWRLNFSSWKRDAIIMTATERNARTVPCLPFFFQTKRLRKRMNCNLFSQSNASNSCSETSTFLVAGVEDRKNPAWWPSDLANSERFFAAILCISIALVVWGTVRFYQPRKMWAGHPHIPRQFRDYKTDIHTLSRRFLSWKFSQILFIQIYWTRSCFQRPYLVTMHSIALV